MKKLRLLCNLTIAALLLFLSTFKSLAQKIQWDKNSSSYTNLEKGEIVRVTLPDKQKKVVASSELLTPKGAKNPLSIRSYDFSEDNQKVMIFTNTKKVWRYHTRGDYWVLNLVTKELKQIGKSFPESSLMFAKFSPNGQKAAYVCKHNIYVEDLSANQVKALTSNGTTKLINGTFDWAYEEEFSCKDGFRWSPDSKSIAYWQIDANTIKDFYMINNTDSIYSKIIPVEYPKVGQKPSACRIAVVNIATAKSVWMKIPGDPANNYIPKMEWAANSSELVVQQLPRKQNETKLFLCNAASGEAKAFYTETDKAWVDVNNRGDDAIGWDWLKNGKDFIWSSEKDGWKHLFKIGKDGKETLLTTGAYDVISFLGFDEEGNNLYFTASPENATQQYLYKTTLDGNGKAERLSSIDQLGTHNYNISSNGKYAQHSFSSSLYSPSSEQISLPDHKPLNENESIKARLARIKPARRNIEFFQVTTEDNVTMDGWMVKPFDFDSTKKYPIVFHVYTEPAGATVKDSYGYGVNSLYIGDMAKEGYIYVSLDGRGTPSPKGREWRKSIYRKIGQVNIRDQAMAAKQLLKRAYIDSSRVAVWGWSGGGSTTLNLLFQYPEIYKVGIAVAAVANQLTYDNIYQERYMGVPQENPEDFVKGSPITYAKNLQGKLLYIHGTGDDNVHYQNAEMLINELIKYNKQFQVMPYPNRTHSISEGEGTDLHLATLFTNYLKQNCPPGAR
ncbi:dipeptidyl-peptidase-4 [Pseudarcicella hirudinis]|uniref:Dipeptidyl-peptidase-4 n=1 Tax=Pseudarcicella hirudinis TaxID=1079859 RepID=A0A1I5RDM0_9BACT|nr:S9 family peptidase [Pseudarcicella hirudinis]SFP56046.1 dipeptidyl-peptidase-4 [Pseudarcicella hirudinis]